MLTFRSHGARGIGPDVAINILPLRGEELRQDSLMTRPFFSFVTGIDKLKLVGHHLHNRTHFRTQNGCYFVRLAELSS